MIVEAQPVDHLVHCFATRRKALTVNARLLQRSPQALGRRVDAPMSSEARRIRQVGQNKWVQFPDDVPLQAAVDFFI
jgi:hypothetical protein